MTKMKPSSNETNETNETTYLESTEGVPTKELMKAARKREYERAKASRKADKAAEKARLIDAKALARTERDKELWSALKRGTDVSEK